MGRVGRTPVIIGVGDVTNRSLDIKDAYEPLHLINQAIDIALHDSGLLSASAKEKLKSSVDSIDVVRPWTWPYPDLPGSIAKRLNVTPKHEHESPHGGNQPTKLLDDAARRISLGECNVAIVTGGEALASCRFNLPCLYVPGTSNNVNSGRVCQSEEFTSAWMDRDGG